MSKIESMMMHVIQMTLPQELLTCIYMLVPKYEVQSILALRLTCQEARATIMSRVDKMSPFNTLLTDDDVISLLGLVVRTLSDGPAGLMCLIKYAKWWMRYGEMRVMMRDHFASLVFMDNLVWALCESEVLSSDMIAKYHREIWDAGVALDEPRMINMLPDDVDSYDAVVEVCCRRQCIRIYWYHHRVDESTDDDIMHMLEELAYEYHYNNTRDLALAQGCVRIAKSLIESRPHLVMRDDFSENMQTTEFERLCL